MRQAWTPEFVDSVQLAIATGKTYAQIAERYGMHPSNIGKGLARFRSNVPCAKFHGATLGGPRRKIYNVWVAMNQRCYNPKDVAYKDYGGRGISVCEEWRKSFSIFSQQMGPRPSGHTLERKNNDGNYEPGNCRWATMMEQNRNRRDNVQVEWEGTQYILTDLCKHLGLFPSHIYWHTYRGKTVKEAFEFIIANKEKRHAQNV